MTALTPGEHEREPQHDAAFGYYDPELRFLRALEREVTQRAIAARRASAAPVGAATHAVRSREADRLASPSTYHGRQRGTGARQARRGSLRSHGTRIARRSLTLVALLCLIGASAYGAGRIFSGSGLNPGDPRQSAFVEAASGGSGADRWSLRLYVRGEELCRVLVVAESESSRCSSPPGGRELSATAVASPTRQYLYGVAGAHIARVQVRAGEEATEVPTHAAADLGATASVLPAGTRWFLAVLLRPAGEPQAHASARGLSSAGRPIGPVVSVCTEAPETLACAR